MAHPAARSVTRLAIVLTVLAVSLFAASPAAAARSEFFGIAQGTLDDRDLQGMEAARIRTDRFLLNWRSMQPSQGSFDWGATDRLVGRLAAHGIRSVPFVWGIPSWVGRGLAPPARAATADRQAWRNFLKAAVARYGPGGSYWTNDYRQQFGPSATPLPIQSWQIWNEPNLKKFFSPGATRPAIGPEVRHAAADLPRRDQEPGSAGPDRARRHARPSRGLEGLGLPRRPLRVPGIKSDFDAAALHPYACELDGVRDGDPAIPRRDDEPRRRGHAAVGHRVRLGIGPSRPASAMNKGLTGQQQLLIELLQDVPEQPHGMERAAPVYWFLWRDPATGSARDLCSFCGTAGLLRYNRTAKPAYNAFKGFTAETTPPQATITSGPTQGSPPRTRPRPSPLPRTRPARPSSAASTPRPFIAVPLAVHPGARRSRTAPTPSSSRRSTPPETRARSGRGRSPSTPSPPPTPQITATDPASPANNNSPKVKGSAAGGSTVKLYKTAGCTGSPAASGSAASVRLARASPPAVADNTTTSFRARAADAAGNASPCSAPRTYVEDSTAPQTTITSGPGARPTTPPPRSPSRRASQARPSSVASTPRRSPPARGRVQATLARPRSPTAPTAFEVRATDRAKNIDATPAKRTFTVAP